MTDTATTIHRPQASAPTTDDQRAGASTHWSTDADRTSVDFAVKTFWGLLTVRGHFDRFSGSYELGPDGPQIELTIEADSLDTGNHKRDEHLRSTDFFAVAEHPHVRFASTRVRDSGDGTLRVEGDLQAAGKAVAVELDATVAQLDEGRLEIEATTTVDQRRLGMSGGVLGMIRRPATLHVKALLSDVARAAAAAPAPGGESASTAPRAAAR
jgi:polyisoprenoid-binding protein YceI